MIEKKSKVIAAILLIAMVFTMMPLGNSVYAAGDGEEIVSFSGISEWNEFVKGKDLDCSKIKATVKNALGEESVIDITNDMVTGFDSSTYDGGMLTITLVVDGKELSKDFYYTITNGKAVSYEAFCEKTVYYQNEPMDLSKIYIRTTYESGDVVDHDHTGWATAGFSTDNLGDITAKFINTEGMQIPFTFKVIPEVKSINTVVGFKKVYDLHEKVKVQGYAQLIMSDNSTQQVPITSDMVSEFDTDTLGTKEVTISYGGATKKVDIQILDYDIRKNDAGEVPIDLRLETYYYGDSSAAATISVYPDKLALETVLPNGSIYYGTDRQDFYVYKNGSYTFTSKSIDGKSTISKTVEVNWIDGVIDTLEKEGGPDVTIVGDKTIGIFKATATDISTKGIWHMYVSNGGGISVGGHFYDSYSFMYTVEGKGKFSVVASDKTNKLTIKEFEVDTTNTHRLLADIEYNTVDDGGDTGNTGGGSTPRNNSTIIITLPTAAEPDRATLGEIKVTGKVDGNGNATADITEKNVTDVFDKALAEAKKNGNEENGITLILRVDTGSKMVSNVSVNLPKAVQDIIISKKIVSIIVVVDNPDIRIDMDLAAVKEINKQAKSDVNLTATRTDSGKLAGDAKKAIGSRPGFDLKVNYGSGNRVQNFGTGSVSVTIPYTLGTNEKAENVCAVYVDDNEKVHWLTGSVYDSVEKVLRFSTDHFSTYGIGYKQTDTTFTDTANHWAKDDIDFVVSRGLFSGTSGTTFSPNTAMTRGMFVTVLGRLANADVNSYKESSFADVKKDAYYMGYIEWANKNGIVNGTGNENFAPDQAITREQMAVIMSNYAKMMGIKLPQAQGENTFADSAKISAYAKDAVKQMQMAGIISGKSGNLFDSKGTATRAEVSAVLHRFVEPAISGGTL